MPEDFTLPPVVPVERLTSRRDRFRCEPLRCDLRAETCLDRQDRGRVKGRAAPAAQSELFAMCVSCALGARVARAFNVPLTAPAAPPATPRVPPLAPARRVCGAACCGNTLRRPPPEPEWTDLCIACVRRAERLVAAGRSAAEAAAALKLAPRDAVTCAVLGCEVLRARAFERTSAQLAGLCRYHRNRAHSLLLRRRVGVPEVLAFLARSGATSAE